MNPVLVGIALIALAAILAARVIGRKIYRRLDDSEDYPESGGEVTSDGGH